MRRSAASFLSFAFALFSLSAAGADDPYWLILEKGKRQFSQGFYGDALISFEEAIRTKKTLFEDAARNLIDALSVSELRRLGDDLSAVEAYIDSRSLVRARAALDVLYSVDDRGAFGNSVQAALARLQALAAYPEAEYWKGEVFRVEGESGVALLQYEKAFKNKAVLEIPGESVSLRYRLAELRAARREYNDMEAVLLSIVAEDGLWVSSSSAFARDAMARTLTTDGADKFLSLYRHSAAETNRAHRALGLYYYKSGRHDRAFSHLLFSFLISSTILIDELRRDDYGFSFSSLAAALDITRFRPAAAAYLEESKYYSTLYYLAASLYANGHRKVAAELWRTIARFPAAGEWAGRASRQALSPSVEPPSENPFIDI